MSLLPLLLLGCATSPWGTWAFTLAYTAPEGDECETAITHNFTGAHPPAAATTEDPAWTTSEDAAVSPQLFFGRVEASGDGAMLIVGAEALPGTLTEAGWTFTWTGEESSDSEASHATGYDYAAHAESTATVRIKGTFSDGTFVGDYYPESTSLQDWSESDTWSDEAAAYVGDNGEAPVGTWLVLTDGAGAEVPANNGRAVYDCETASCTLAVETACASRYALTGELTEFAAEDAPWTEDAGQPAGL